MFCVTEPFVMAVQSDGSEDQISKCNNFYV